MHHHASDPTATARRIDAAALCLVLLGALMLGALVGYAGARLVLGWSP